MTMYHFIMPTYHFIQSVNCACVLGHSGVSDSLRPVDCGHRAPLSVGLARQEHEWVAVSFSRELPVPGVEPASPALAGDSSPLAPPQGTYVNQRALNLLQNTASTSLSLNSVVFLPLPIYAYVTRMHYLD